MKKSYLLFAIVLLTSKIFASYVSGVPYFYQYNNTINAGGSCQNTSTAMCIKFFGGSTETPDAISSIYGTSMAQTVSGLESVFNSEAANFNLTVRDVGHTDGTFAQIQAQLAAGIPVIVHGYFTSYGHVMVLTGFDGTDYIANDPAGKWDQIYQVGGYCQCNATEGQDIHYSQAAMEQAIGPDGSVWYHEFTNITSTDIVAPTTSISISNASNYETTNFTSNFTDADNTSGSGLDKSFYSILDYTGSEWRANNQSGFFCDNFDYAIHPDWSNYSGAWSIQNNALYQSDETNTNTDLSASLNQVLSNRYIYHFKGKIDGSGTNRCAGIHVFCDDITQFNRGNNYLIWFKSDVSEIHIYKISNNTIGSPLCVFSNINIQTSTWYDYKIMYDRTTGKFSIWMNDQLKGTYIDSSNPLFTGAGISLRSSECNFAVDDIKVYRSRTSTVNVSIGSSSADVRYQSPGPGSYACEVKSLDVDVAGNISAIADESLLIDWTSPSAISYINDGLSSDIDTIYNTNQLSANWAASTDANSGVTKYWYAIGTTRGASDVVGWTNNSVNTSVTKTGLILTNSQVYYFSVKAEDAAGLFSGIINSNGQAVIFTTTGINSIENNEISIFPNPTTGKFILQSYILIKELIVYNVRGENIYSAKLNSKQIELDLSEQPTGVYYIELQSEQTIIRKKIIIGR